MSNKKKTYQKFVASAVTTAVVASAIVPVASAGAIKDVKANSFGEKEINYLTSNNIIQGYADDTFRPAEKLNRGQAARLFARALNLSPKTNNQHGFKDVPKNGELAAAVSAVSAAGIFKGANGEFDPNRPLTRQEMASVLVRAFNLKANTTAVNLKDLNSISPAHLNDVKVLYQNGVTVGFKDQTFRPSGTVTRAEFAVFLYRGVAPVKIEAVTDTTLKANGNTYQIAANLKGLFNSKNAAVLKNANVKFELQNNQITKVTYLEIVESGKSATTEFDGNLVLDAGNASVAGDVKVSANYISLKNLTINGNLEIGKELLNDFYSSNLVVKGQTIVNGGDTNTVVFENGSLRAVTVNKQNVRVEAKGNTTLTEMTINSDATITADAGVIIPKVSVQSGVKSLELNANVKDLSLQSREDFVLSGNGSIDNVKVETNKKVNLIVKGTIKNLELTSNATITLDPALKIDKLVLPAGTDPSKVISNYDTIKDNVGSVVVGGNPGTNPGTGNPGTGNPGGGTGDATPPVVTSSVQSGVYTSVQNVILSANESATIYYTLNGTSPTTSSTVYRGPITVSKNSSVTIKYFAVDASGNPSAVQTKVITVVPTKQEMLGKAKDFYGSLTPAQIAALNDVKDAIDDSDIDWAYILGLVEDKVDSKLGEGTAQSIIRDVITVAVTSTEETFESNIEALRAKYAEDFDTVFGPDVTVEKLVLYANVIQAELRKSTNKSRLITILTDSVTDNRGQLEEFLKEIRNQVETNHPEFADFDAQLLSSIGVDFYGLVGIGHRLYEEVEPKVSDESSTVLKQLINSLFVQYVPEDLQSIAERFDFVGLIISFKDEEVVSVASTTITVG